VKRILVLGVSALVLFLGGWTWLAMYPALPVDLGGAPNLDGEARHLRLAVADGDSVDAWYLPGSEPGVVLLFHGFGRTHHRMWRYAQFLRRAGYHLLAIDFRSAREPHRLPSTLGYYEAADAQAAYDWVRAQPSLRGYTLGVLGESLGGSLALRLAATHRDVDAVVDDSGFTTGEQAIADAFRSFYLPAWPCTPLARWLAVRMTGVDPGQANTLDAARALGDRPILFIHGEKDRRLPMARTRDLWRAAGGKDSLWIVPGAGHNEGWKRDPKGYEQRVTSFFDEYLLLAWAQRGTGRSRP
jgi:pimeloyl-ACP methyl ester carboxylesterase